MATVLIDESTSTNRVSTLQEELNSSFVVKVEVASGSSVPSETYIELAFRYEGNNRLSDSELNFVRLKSNFTDELMIQDYPAIIDGVYRFTTNGDGVKALLSGILE